MTPHESNGFNPIGDSPLIYALIAEPREKTTGFQAVAWGDGNSVPLVDLEATLADKQTSDKPYYHSSQFNRTLLKNAGFYESLASELGLRDV